MTDKVVKRVCGVCGDKAFKYNFNALTCESCKAYFRRNTSKYERLECHFGGNCKISVANRKSCKKCRYDKCLAIGMRKEYIMTETQKEFRKMKIEYNRQKRNRKNRKDKSYTTNDSSSEAQITSTTDSIDIIDELFAEFDKMENNTNFIDISDVSLYQTQTELSPPVPIARPITDYNNTFNELEGNRLSELLSAVHIFESNPIPVTRTATIPDDVCEVWTVKCESEVKKIVTMAKNLRAFAGLCENDQLSLVKYGSVEIYFLRNIKNYDFESQYWTYATDERNSTLVTLELMRECELEWYSAHKDFIRIMSILWDRDPIVVDLLCAILLFNPNRPYLQQKSVVKFQQQVYSYLLQRYLQLKYQSQSESKTKSFKLFNTFTALQHLKNVYKDVYSVKAPQEIHPILLEILDIDSQITEYNCTSNMFLNYV